MLVKYPMNKFSIILIIILSLFITGAKQPHFANKAAFEAQEKWVDSLYTNMTQKERFAQLLTITAYSDKDLAHDNRVKLQIMKQHVGGIHFMGGNPTHQVELTNQFQKLSKVPLLISMNAAQDFGKKLDSTHTFPYNLMLGAIKSDTIIENIGKHIGQHSKQLGVHVVFAPKSVVQTADNRIFVGNQSYGEDIANVTKKVTAFTKGIQSTGTMAVATNFPSFPNTATTTENIPELTLSVEALDSIQFPVYKELIKQKIGGVQTTHILVPSMTSVSSSPASFSHNVVTKKLKHELGFQGLTFSPLLNDKRLLQDKEISEVALAAFLAGNDVLLLPGDVQPVIAKFEEAYNEGMLKEADVSRAVKNILRAKYKAGLQTFEPLSEVAVVEKLSSGKDKAVHYKAVKHAITALKVDNSILPIRNLAQQKIAYIKMGDASEAAFLNTLLKYATIDVIEEKNLADLTEKLKSYTTVIVGLHKSDASPTAAYNFTEREIVWLQELSRESKVILAVFASPHSLSKVKSFTNIDNILVSYQNSEFSQEVTAQIIFGAVKAQGKLPIVIKDEFPISSGVETQTLARLGYDFPEAVGLNSKKLSKIDSLAALVVSEEMAPGVQLLIARKGKIIYNKNFGYHTYEKKHKVTDYDLYDVASMTKILATLPLVMKLEESKKMSLTSKLEDLLPMFKETNKDTLKVVEILSHYARLKPWIPFYINTLDSVTKKPDRRWYRRKQSKKFNIKVADKLYMKAEYKDSMMQRIIDSDLLKRHRYRYSDLPFYILKEYVETMYNSDLNAVTQQYFYKSLGAHRTTYNPLEKFSKDMIVPSEKDDYYRNQVVQGYVHDMGAAMQGGIGGHAGLFSTANDVAKMMQMYLQNGVYGDVKYLDATTIAKFNNCYYCDKDNRRGVGFDKPQLGDVGPTCGCVSMKSFGHSGFTGTYTWADPEEEIVYVFLSNRTFPTMSNRKLIKTNIRTEIQQLIYEAIEK
jgi:beta-glucosidase-like glycosyl hydrolase/CubicO group peptidase (beta-lactamase class C family)